MNGLTIILWVYMTVSVGMAVLCTAVCMRSAQISRQLEAAQITIT